MFLSPSLIVALDTGRLFKPRPRCSPNPNRVGIVCKPNQTVSTAL